MDAIIQFGELPESGLVDEANLLVQSLTKSPTRNLQEYRGGNGATFAARLTDPKLGFNFRGYIQAYEGMCDAGPGFEIEALLNFEGAFAGFDPADGVMFITEASHDLDLDNPGQLNATIMHYPFIDAAA